MSHLSIIIAGWGSDTMLESTIAPVLEHLPPDADVFVAHDGSYQDPYELGDEVQFIIVPGASSWMQLANAAASEADTPFLHFMLAGAQVSAGWTEPALRTLEEQQAGSVCPVLLNASNQRKVVSVGASWTGGGPALPGRNSSYRERTAARCQPVGPNHVAAFYARDVWEEAGGYDESTSMELAATDLALRMKAAGHHTAVAASCCVDAPADLLVSNEPAAVRAYQRERIVRRHTPHGSPILRTLRIPYAIARATLSAGIAAPAACVRAWTETPSGTHNSFASEISAPDIIPMPSPVASIPHRRAA